MLSQRLFSLISSSSMRKIVPTTWLTAPSLRVPQTSECVIFTSVSLSRKRRDSSVNVASYENLESVLNDPKSYVIDVREPIELQETGVIPNSINIPLAHVEDELKDTNPDDFKAKFQRDKPNHDSQIIFTCRTGRRSLQASKIAQHLGGIRMISSDNSKIASYTDVKEIGRNGLLIDVREPQELQETGILPNSINIPLAQVEAAFKDLSDDEFMKKYGRNKPTVQTSLVFSCKMGVRSDTAMKIVEKIGYSNVRNYKGGWVDWEQQQQEQQQNKH